MSPGSYIIAASTLMAVVVMLTGRDVATAKETLKGIDIEEVNDAIAYLGDDSRSTTNSTNARIVLCTDTDASPCNAFPVVYRCCGFVPANPAACACFAADLKPLANDVTCKKSS